MTGVYIFYFIEGIILIALIKISVFAGKKIRKIYCLNYGYGEKRTLDATLAIIFVVMLLGFIL